MRSRKTLIVLLVLAPSLAVGQSKAKKATLPAMFNQARYVYVEAVAGQEFDPRLDPEDRQAIADVNKAVYDWKRYALTMERKQADLIFVVRKGRLVEARTEVHVSSRGQSAPTQPPNDPPAGNGFGLGGEVGPSDDLLEVYLPNPDDPRGTLLWRGMLADGLSQPKLALFKQLKDEVERTYPTQTASKPSKP